MNFQEIKEVLDEFEVTPSRKLGQNFLIDQNVSSWIVDQLDVQPEDTVVEVGPGTGALTEQVVNRCKRLILVEFDARLAAYQKERYKDVDHVTVHHADGSRFDIRQLFPYQPIKFLGNLPYSAGGAIMRNFLNRPSPVVRAVLMLQKEFIDRIIAKPRTKDYGVLTLRIQSEWEGRPLKTISPECFHPRPVIDSTVMVLEKRRDELPVFDARLFDELVRRGFAQRRKQVKKQLPEDFDWAAISEKLGISFTARAEEISLEQWVTMTNLYDPLTDGGQALAQSEDEVFDVVNAEDEVVSQATRGEVHKQGLMHRAVHVLVFNKHREVFLQKRSRLKDVCPGLWGSSASGHVDAGETYDASALREVCEELGVDEPDLQHIGQLAPSEENGFEHVAIYLARHDGAMRCPCNEIEAGQWFKMETVELWLQRRPEDFSPGFMQVWAEFQKLADERA